MKPMLAKDGLQRPKKMVGMKLIDYKLDGVRVLTVIKDQKVSMFSRNWKPLLNFSHITKYLEFLKIEEDVVLDGEITSHSFQALMKQVHRKKDVNASDAVLNLFDIIPYDEFMAGKSTKTQINRCMDLLGFCSKLKYKKIVRVHYQTIDLDTQNKRFLEINRLAIEKKYEGIMVKDPHALYEGKRSDAWLKIKPFMEVTCKIIGYEEGAGKYVGTMGNLLCVAHEEDKDINVSVGSGFTDELRDALWARRDELEGQLIEIRADSISTNEKGGHSLRFPRFKTFRGFDPLEKL